MEVEHQGQLLEITDYGDLVERFSDLNGKNALVFTTGDRKVRATLKNLIWSVENKSLVLEENIEGIDEGYRIEIPISAISKVKIFEECADAEIQHYIVFQLGEENEIHIHSLVA